MMSSSDNVATASSGSHHHRLTTMQQQRKRGRVIASRLLSIFGLLFLALIPQVVLINKRKNQSKKNDQNVNLDQPHQHHDHDQSARTTTGLMNNNTTTTSTISSPTQQQQLSLLQLKFPLKNILLMGQFNYDFDDTTFDSTQSWYSIYSKYVIRQNIIVAGPSTPTTVKRLQDSNISYVVGRNDKGHSSPYLNLAKVLEQQQQLEEAGGGTRSNNNNNNIDGVLYLHDDALFNFSHFFFSKGEGEEDEMYHRIAVTSPTDEIFKQRRWYKMQINLIRHQNNNNKNNNITTNSKFQYMSYEGTKYRGKKDLQKKALIKWTWNGSDRNCFLPFEELLKNNPEYVMKYGIPIIHTTTKTRMSYILDFAGYGQADMFWIPLKRSTSTSSEDSVNNDDNNNYKSLINEFLYLANLYGKYNMFLECAIPNIAYRLSTFMLSTLMSSSSSSSQSKSQLPPQPSSLKQQQQHPLLIQQQTKTLSLCTSWNHKKDRGKIGMIRNCWENSKDQIGSIQDDDDDEEGNGGGNNNKLQQQKGFHVFHPFKLGIHGHDVYEKWLHKIQKPL